jgi:hypothetical protein
MNEVKAKLQVILKADETVVAVSEDPALWQRMLLAIGAGGTSVERSFTKVEVGAVPQIEKLVQDTQVQPPRR